MKTAKGFTLIELMIVVAVVAILAAVAFPSYQESVRKSNRTDCKVALSAAVAMQERWYFRNNSYTDKVNEIGGSVGPPATLNSPEGFCGITIDVSCAGGGTIDCFTLKATPQGAQKNDKCGILTVTNTGLKGVENATYSVDECW